MKKGAMAMGKGREESLRAVISEEVEIGERGILESYADEEPDAPFMEAVVKVYATRTEPDFSLPWQKRRQFSSTGSGFIIGGRRVLTNVHCVEHHTQVKLKRRGDDTKFVAKVLAMGTECDIALLSVEDDAFWEGVEPLKFGLLPRLQDAVTVVGYPVGGDTISVTSGVVSRIEVTSYVHGSCELLGIQIDAAINSGNSGGPAFNDAGECVGIAFQSYKGHDAENIGYIIPTPVIYHFLTDYERNSRYTGFPMLGIMWQNLENPALRASLGMTTQQKGVLLRSVYPTAEAGKLKLLQEGDVLMSFDGVGISNDGTIPFRTGERISFGFLISQKFAGETAELKVLRAGDEVDIQVPLNTVNKLVPVHIDGKLPSYFIVAGLVFTPVCQPFLISEYGVEFEFDTPVNILHKMLHGMPEFDNQQVVVLSQVLANNVNIGYEEISNAPVTKFNDVPIQNLHHLVHLVESCTDTYMRFTLEQIGLVVLETNIARSATPQVLEDHCITWDRSADLRESQTDSAENGKSLTGDINGAATVSVITD